MSIRGTVFDSPNMSPSLRQGLRALAVAGTEFEPFVDWIVGSDVLGKLDGMGLAEQGESSRPSVGSIGYRLTDLGWQAVEQLWGYTAACRDRQIVS